MKLFLNFLSKVVIALFIIFSVNMIVGSSNFIIPINIFSITSYVCLGVFGLVGFTLLYVLI